MTFYDLEESDRIALTKQAIDQRRTLYERWSVLVDSEAGVWGPRARIAAEFLRDDTAVADLGCGTMTLERVLPAGTAYFPADVVRRDHRTTVCDFNTSEPPKLPASTACCLGLLEYLFDPAEFMGKLARNYSKCVVSYCPNDAPEPIEPRRSHAWVNDFSRTQIEGIFIQSGWVIERFEHTSQAEFIWQLNAAA